MGYAEIQSGGTDGRYTIRIDGGQAERDAAIVLIDKDLAQIAQKLAALVAKIADADAAEAAAVARLQAAWDAWIIEANATPPTSPPPPSPQITKALKDLASIKQKNVPLRLQQQALKVAQASSTKLRARFAAVNAIDTREAWCCDLTESGSGGVATVEIPGEEALVLIAPGARGWQPTDGVLKVREIQSPEQVFFNAAVLPGWQKYLPTYRWGTLTAIDWDANTGDVTLGPAASSAQGLDVNQAGTLTGLPFGYMTCGARAFDRTSRVVVEFVAQDWARAKIVGFLDNPKRCPPVFSGSISSVTVYLDSEMSTLFFAGNWTGGYTPNRYELASGTLPAGLTLNPTVGTITGRPTVKGEAARLVVRGYDQQYVPGENRRYADSNEFIITTAKDWEFFDAALPVNSEADIEAGNGIVVSLGLVSGTRYLFATKNYGSPPVDTAAWMTGAGAAGVPALWHRITHTGQNNEPPFGPAASAAWVSGVAGVWTWEIPAGYATPSILVEAQYTIHIATDAAGVNIVATLTGSVSINFDDGLGG